MELDELGHGLQLIRGLWGSRFRIGADGCLPLLVGAVLRLRWRHNRLGLCDLIIAASDRRSIKASWRRALRDPSRAGSAARLRTLVKALDWLLESDPAIRWQALRDLADAPADVVAAERARVATEGWGARLLD